MMIVYNYGAYSININGVTEWTKIHWFGLDRYVVPQTPLSMKIVGEYLHLNVEQFVTTFPHWIEELWTINWQFLLIVIKMLYFAVYFVIFERKAVRSETLATNHWLSNMNTYVVTDTFSYIYYIIVH